MKRADRLFPSSSEPRIQRRPAPSGPASEGDRQPGGPHAIAQEGIEGGGGWPLAQVAPIQSAFGPHDLSSVRVHSDTSAQAASAALGAQAYTYGEHIATRSDDLYTLAHEAAHVVQQRQGVSLPQGVGQRGDPHERRADAVAQRVTQGRGASDLLPSSPSTPARAGALQRFESNEHKLMGDQGVRLSVVSSEQVELAPGLRVTFGDLTAMSGDYFGSADEIKRLAATEGEGEGARGEIYYVLEQKLGQKLPEGASYNEEAKAAVEARYLELAAQNASHFTSPSGESEATSSNNRGNYHENHKQAILNAATAGKEGASLHLALLYEGFASHFLTDSFAAGHLRTERTSINDYWNAKVPLFWTNVKLMMAQYVAQYINDETWVAGTIKTVEGLWLAVVDSLKDLDLPTLTLGDLIAGAVHDYDNYHGVKTNQGVLYGDGSVMTHNSSVRSQGAKTAEKAIGAVESSLDEVVLAYELGKAADADSVLAGRLTNGLFATEQVWPRALSDAQQPEARKSLDWKQADIATLLGDPKMKKAIEIFGKGKADTLAESLPPFADQTAVSAEVQRAGVMTFVEELRSNPVSLLGQIVDFVPDVDNAIRADNATMDYANMLKTEGDLDKLTQNQRVRMIAEFLDGDTTSKEQLMIVYIFRGTEPDMLVELVKELGGGNVQTGLTKLESRFNSSYWILMLDELKKSRQLAYYLR